MCGIWKKLLYIENWGLYMTSLKRIIPIWLIANFLFIPGFKSLGLVLDDSQHICVISVDDVSAISVDDVSSKNQILKSHCENCNFFFDNDYDSSLLIADFNPYLVLYKSSIVFGSHIFNSNYHYTHTRAPPFLS